MTQANKPVQILSAPALEDWEQCQRRAVWHREWELGRVTPYRALVEAVEYGLLGNSIFTIDAENSFQHVMSLAGSRGVWAERADPYAMMVHYGRLAQILVTAVLAHPGNLVKPFRLRHEIRPGLVWECNSFMTSVNRLVRVVIVDRWDDDRQLRELHSWRTVGDICVTGLAMDLLVLVIGPSRDGRRHGPWTKGWQHPVNHSLKFKRTHQGKKVPLVGGWRPVWRENASEITTDQWLKQMESDYVLRDVMLVRKVKVPESEQRQRVLIDIERIACEIDRGQRMERDGSSYPMNRSACDWPRPCPFQAVCYAPMEIGPGDVNLFRRRDRELERNQLSNGLSNDSLSSLEPLK